MQAEIWRICEGIDIKRVDNRRNIKFSRAKCIAMGPLNRDSRFRVVMQRVRKSYNSLFGRLAKTQINKLPTKNEVEIPELHWYTVEKDTQRLREIKMLEWSYCVRPGHSPQEALEDTPFTTTMRKRFVRGTPASCSALIWIIETQSHHSSINTWGPSL